jgi:hypothetical protein
MALRITSPWRGKRPLLLRLVTRHPSSTQFLLAASMGEILSHGKPLRLLHGKSFGMLAERAALARVIAMSVGISIQGTVRLVGVCLHPRS